MIKGGGGYLLSMVLLMGLLAPPLYPRSRSTLRRPQHEVVMLGNWDPRSGPGSFRAGHGNCGQRRASYLIDFGPGVVRRAKAAVIEKGLRRLEPINLRVAFATHLHSDHTVGYPDLILTPWVIGRRVPLEVSWSDGYQGDDAAYPRSVRRGYQSARPDLTAISMDFRRALGPMRTR